METDDRQHQACVELLIKSGDKWCVNTNAKAGDAVDPGGKYKIDTVLGQDEEVMAYILSGSKWGERPQLRWVHSSEPLATELLPSVRRFDGLLQSINETVPRIHRRQTFRRLGKAMFLAMHLDLPEEERAKCFRDVQQAVSRHSLNWNRFVYLIFNVITFIAISVPLIIWLMKVPGGWRMQLPTVSVLAGGAGALLSVLQRNHKVPLAPFEATYMVVFQAIARIVIGNAFGLLLYLAVQGDLILGAAVAQDVNRLIIFSVVAGISERLIPELLERIEGQGTNQNKEKAPNQTDSTAGKKPDSDAEGVKEK
jgi:uncharacterized membrane protein YsdA (DUF1294 family)